MELNSNSGNYLNTNTDLSLVKKIVNNINCRNGEYDKNQAFVSSMNSRAQENDAAMVDISNAAKELANNNINKISAINNSLTLNDPIIDYFNRVGTIDKISPDGTIQWDLGSVDTEKMESEIFQNISQTNYRFWSYLTGDPTFIGLQYSDDEIRERLLAANIKPGFFNVTVGDKTATQFFSQGKGAAAVYSKKQYDNHYAYITSERYLSRYEVGQKLLIGEKEYTLGEDKKLNISYGEDVYDIKILSE